MTENYDYLIVGFFLLKKSETEMLNIQHLRFF